MTGMELAGMAIMMGVQGGVGIYQTERQMTAFRENLAFQKEENRRYRNHDRALAQISSYTDLMISRDSNYYGYKHHELDVVESAISAHSSGYGYG